MLNNDTLLTPTHHLMRNDKHALAIFAEALAGITNDLLDGKVPYYYHTNELDELTAGTHQETHFTTIMKVVWEQSDVVDCGDYHPPCSAFPKVMKEFRAEFKRFHENHIIDKV